MRDEETEDSRKMTRRTVLAAGAATGIGTLLSPLVAYAGGGSAQSKGQALFQPPGRAGIVPASNLTPGGIVPQVHRFTLKQENIDLPGVSGPAMTVNGSVPGPELRCREGDLLRIIVENKMQMPASVHWHGLLVPNAMDGVPGLTQKPIPPNGLFVYEYPVQQSGTYWYHSHYQLESQLGLHGPLIIEPKHEPHSYDQEIVIFLSDWLNWDPWKVIPHIRDNDLPPDIKPPTGAMGSMGSTQGARGGPKPFGLWNGDSFNVDLAYPTYLINGQSPENPFSVSVKKGSRVRVRLINGSDSSFFRFSIDGHPLNIIASDGQPVMPVEVDDLMICTAERYDFLVDIPESGSFGIRADALGQVRGVSGIMHTTDARPVLPNITPKWGPRTLAYTDLVAPVSTEPAPGPTQFIPLELAGNMKTYIWRMGDKSLKTLFNPNGNAEPLIVDWGNRVTIEYENKSGMYHPMHLHGHFFRLLVDNGKPTHAPLKDTVAVPPHQKVRIEFVADNPGTWFCHCHNMYHLEAGMGRVIEYRI